MRRLAMRVGGVITIFALVGGAVRIRAGAQGEVLEMSLTPGNNVAIHFERVNDFTAATEHRPQ